MADAKISALPAAATPLAGTEVLPVVQGGVTDKVSVANLTVGRDVGVKKLNATDNVVISTAGKGIDFSANTNAPGMTSELLTWYEEGTWTPNFNNFTFSGTQTVLTATYTRIGRLVFLQATFSNSLTQSASGGTSYIDGLPFGASVSGTIMFMNEATAASIGVGEVYGPNDRLYPPTYSTSVANDVILMSGCYIV